MKKLIVLSMVLFFGAAGWSVGQRLSADALSMAIGVVFGILSGIPVALLVLAASRRGERQPDMPRRQHSDGANSGYPAPVIVVSPPAGSYGQGYGQGHGLAGPPVAPQAYLPTSPGFVDGSGRREFRVVGAEEEWEED